MIHCKINKYCYENNRITKNQHGFVSKKGFTTNLFESRDILTEAIHQGHSVDVIYTDVAKAFAKAFDKVPLID